MRRTLQQIAQSDFSDLKGTHIAGALPISQAAINAALREQIAKRRSPIQELHVTIYGSNRLQIGIKVGVGPFTKWFRPELTVAEQAVWSGSPMMLFTITSAHYGPIAWLIELLGKKALPAGVLMRGREVTIDFAVLPQTSRFREYFQHIKQIDITTSLEKLLLQVEVRID
jgi:hypothetical protein